MGGPPKNGGGGVAGPGGGTSDCGAGGAGGGSSDCGADGAGSVATGDHGSVAAGDNRSVAAPGGAHGDGAGASPETEVPNSSVTNLSLLGRTSTGVRINEVYRMELGTG